MSGTWSCLVRDDRRRGRTPRWWERFTETASEGRRRPRFLRVTLLWPLFCPTPLTQCLPCLSPRRKNAFLFFFFPSSTRAETRPSRPLMAPNLFALLTSRPSSHSERSTARTHARTYARTAGLFVRDGRRDAIYRGGFPSTGSGDVGRWSGFGSVRQPILGQKILSLSSFGSRAGERQGGGRKGGLLVTPSAVSTTM